MEQLTSSDQQVGPLAAYLQRHLAGPEAQTHLLGTNVMDATKGPTKPGEGLERAELQAGQGMQSFQGADGNAAELLGSRSHHLEKMGAKKEEFEQRLGDGEGPARERPTVVRIKRRRTESPLDALMLEVASRREGPVGLDDAIVRLALEEQPTSRKLFRRIDTVSEADLTVVGAGESILKRLSRLQRVGSTDVERGSPDQNNVGSTDRGSFDGSGIAPFEEAGPSEEASSQLESEQKNRNVLASASEPAAIFRATEATAKAAKRPERSSNQRSSEAHGRTKEEILGEGLRKGRQQEVLEAGRREHLEVARAARYEQVRVHREAADPMGELFQLYDVIRVDAEGERRAAEREGRKRAVREASERHALMMNYMPLLREFVPKAAADLQAPATWQDEEPAPLEDDVSDEEYVYDVFAVEERGAGDDADELHPVVRVADDLDMRTADEAPSDYDSEDSNDENNPDNDYPEDEFAEAADAASDASSRDSEFDVYADDDEEYDVMAYDEDGSDEDGAQMRSVSTWAMRR